MNTVRFGLLPMAVVGCVLQMTPVLTMAQGSDVETIAYWRFGDQGLNDVTGHGHTLANANVDLESCGAAIFNGSNASLETVEPLDLSSYSQLTVECWMKPDEQASSAGILFQSLGKDESSAIRPGSFVIYFAKDAHNFQAQLRDSTSDWTISRVLTNSGVPYQGGWHHVALVMDITGNVSYSGKSKLYIDGQLIEGYRSVQSTVVHQFLGGTKFIIAGPGVYAGADQYFKGAVDDVRITAGCLTPDQFLKFPTYGKKQSPESPAVAFWPFGRRGVNDATGNGYDLAYYENGVSFGNGCVTFNGNGGLQSTGAIPADVFSHSGFTYEFFIRSRAGSGTSVLLENSGAYSDSSGRWLVRMNNETELQGGIKMDDGKFNSSRSVSGDPQLNDGEWHHVAAVYDPKASGENRCRVYLDGSLLGHLSTDVSDSLAELDGSCSFFVGGRKRKEFPFVGDIDDLRVMPWALQPEEFLKTRSLDAEIAHWKFDDAETALADLTGNGHDLVNQNGVVFQDGSAYFNGKNANLISQSAIDLSGCSQLTIEGVVQYDDTTSVSVLFDCGDTSQVGGYVLYSNQETLYSQLRVVQGSTWQQHKKTGLDSYRGQWHHFALVFNMGIKGNDQSQLWIDGVQCPYQSGGSAAANFLNNDTFSIGGGGEYGSSAYGKYLTSFKGRVSEVVLTSSALQDDSFKLLNFKPETSEKILQQDAKVSGEFAIDLTGKANLTVECFAKFSANPAGSLLRFGPDNGGPSLEVKVDGSVLSGALKPTTGGLNREWADIPSDGGWHHIALVRDVEAAFVDQVRLYVDGVRTETHVERVNSDEAFSSGTLTIADGFAGKISTCRVTSGALAPEAFLKERVKDGLGLIFR